MPLDTRSVSMREMKRARAKLKHEVSQFVTAISLDVCTCGEGIVFLILVLNSRVLNVDNSRAS